MRLFTLTLLSICILTACAQAPEKQNETEVQQDYPVQKTEAEWKTELNDLEFRVIREKGTESSGSGDLLYNKKQGIYTCRACGNALYASDTKFESGTGWPSFYDCIEGSVEEDSDVTFGMMRTEILCADCGGHLGHVFNDGPAPTGLRHCVNAVSLDFEAQEGQ